MFGALDQPSLLFMSLFQYMIGNSDYSILKLHNVMILRDAKSVRFPVPYDFDYSGLVDAHYAIPAKELGLASVRDRLYRGPCKTDAEVEQALEPFRKRQAELLALPASLPDFDDGHRRNAEKYLNEFFELIAKPDRVKKTFVTNCTPIVGM
jgi:Fe-S-cluster formation regulator IscX/YfhJ